MPPNEYPYDPRELRALSAVIYGPVSEAAQVHNRKLPAHMRDELIGRAVEESVLAAEKILQVTEQRVAIAAMPRARALLPMGPPNGSHVAEVIEEHNRRVAGGMPIEEAPFPQGGPFQPPPA